MVKSRRFIKCIVNADDFGISESVNDATVALMEGGAVTSATIMANGAAFDQAIAAAKKLPDCSFGVHLNVTQFAPLSKSDVIRTFLTANGEFSSEKLPRILWPSLQRAILEEFQLQIDRVRSALGRVSHVDSHHHVHTLPIIFPVLAWLVRSNGVKAVRLTKNLYPQASNPGRGHLLKKQIWNMALSVVCGAKTCNFFGDLAGFYTNVARLDGAVVEIMMHPGHPGFTGETQTLSDDWRSQIDADIELISYDALT